MVAGIRLSDLPSLNNFQWLTTTVLTHFVGTSVFWSFSVSLSYFSMAENVLSPQTIWGSF